MKHALLFLTLAAAPSAQAVHVVDNTNGPGTDFTSLATAVSASSSGDILLVRPGRYIETLEIASKSLTVVAEPGPFSGTPAVVVTSILVRDLAAEDVVFVRGISTFGISLVPALEGRNSFGKIWVEDHTGLLDSGFGGGARFVDCASVVLTRLTLVDPHTSPFHLIPPALECTRSTVKLYDSTIEGGSYHGPGMTAGRDGLTGVLVSDANLFAQGCDIRGGRGEDGVFISCDGGNGGAGVTVVGAGSVVETLGCSLTGGLGGIGCSPDRRGDDGAPAAVLGGTWTNAETPARSLTLSSPVRDDELCTLTYQGRPGDRVWLRVSLEPVAGTISPLFEGVRLIGPFVARSFRGTLGASGLETESVPMVDLGPGVEGRRFHAQAVFLGSGEIVQSSPSTTVVVDGAF